jgi:hypothetical protein
LISWQRKRIVLLAASLSASSLAGSPAADLPHPGPATRGAKPSGVAQNGRCETCHAQIAREWRTSRHHTSFSNRAFQDSVRREGEKGFCIDCHAPETTLSGAPTHDEGELGVGCITCHVPKDSLLAAPSANTPQAPHQLETRADFASAEACRGCHEFRFTEPRPSWASEPAQWMQRTWREHHDGNVDGSSAGCSDCHLPRAVDGSGNSYRRHDFPGGYDPQMVRRSLRITARRTGPSRLEITLQPADVTHAVPTGDLFRRLALSARTTGAHPSKVVRYLARHHRDVGRGMRVEVDDDRPRVRASVVTLDLGPNAGQSPIEYRVTYQRVDQLLGNDEARAVVIGEIELAAGVLQAAATRH